MPRPPLYHVDLDATDTYPDCLNVQNIPPGHLAITLKVLRSLRDAAQHPNESMHGFAKLLSKTHARLWLGAQKRIKARKKPFNHCSSGRMSTWFVVTTCISAALKPAARMTSLKK